jgi:hypothetical protein
LVVHPDRDINHLGSGHNKCATVANIDGCLVQSASYLPTNIGNRAGHVVYLGESFGAKLNHNPVRTAEICRTEQLVFRSATRSAAFLDFGHTARELEIRRRYDSSGHDALLPPLLDAL